MKKAKLNTLIGLLAIGLSSVTLLAGCDSAADIASKNTSTAGDNFELYRSFHFLNTRTDKELMRVEGYCAKDNGSTANTLIVTCRDRETGGIKKHYMGLSTDTTYFIEQVDAASISTRHARVIFAPSTLIPDLEVR